MCNYWLHRISHEREVSYDLLEKEYLTIGWSNFIGTDILKAIEKGEDEYRKFTEEKHNITSRSKWNLWYFSKIEVDDFVLVPMDNGEYGIYKVKSKIKPIADLSLKFANKGFVTKNGKDIEITKDRIYNKTDKVKFDLGFFIEVEKIIISKREYVSAKLIARMKMRQATGNINDLSDEVEQAKKAKKPKNIRGEILNAMSEIFIKSNFFNKYTPEQIEILVKLYFEKMGATNIEIPPKNDSLKKEESDVDVIASFEDLNILFYVQVKHHEGETDTQAISQLTNYKEYNFNKEDQTTSIAWAITTAKFSDKAKEEARKNNIRLIEGNEFAKMLLNAGISNLDIDRK